jgi:hypothetical protein
MWCVSNPGKVENAAKSLLSQEVDLSLIQYRNVPNFKILLSIMGLAAVSACILTVGSSVT